MKTEKTRKEFAAFVNNQLGYEYMKPAGDCHHYGRQELRQLADFLYGDEPASDEKIIAENGSIK